MSDFVVQRILGLRPTPEANSDTSNKQNASTVTAPKVPSGLHDLQLITGGLTHPLVDYATTLQLMQLQMYYQPGLLNSFFNQMAAMELAMNTNFNKVYDRYHQ